MKLFVYSENLLKFFHFPATMKFPTAWKRCSVLGKEILMKKGIFSGKDQKLFGGTKDKNERREFGKITPSSCGSLPKVDAMSNVEMITSLAHDLKHSAKNVLVIAQGCEFSLLQSCMRAFFVFYLDTYFQVCPL
jgi:hypothetical protein